MLGKALATAALIVLATVAAGCGGGAPTTSATPAAASTAIATPPATVVPTPQPPPTAPRMAAAGFRVPLTFVLPADSGIDLGPQTAVLQEFRVPDSGGEGQSAWFLIVQAVEGGRVDRCSPTSAPLPLDSARAAIDYLATVPTIEIVDDVPSVLGGIPAVTAEVRLTPGTPKCRELWLWAPEAEPVPDAFRDPDRYARVTALEVDGEIVVVTTYAIERADEWLPIVDELIASFEFEAD